jgi:hypothetical protein
MTEDLNISPISNRGDSASCAFFTAVTVFVRPGPAVTAATPIVLDSLATASAANTAVTCTKNKCNDSYCYFTIVIKVKCN